MAGARAQSCGRAAVVLLCAGAALATSRASADEIAISFEIAGDCPSRGELLDALGPEFGTEGARRIAVAVEDVGEGQHLHVAEPGREPADREIPPADCATRARLIAIMVRGYVSEGASRRRVPAPFVFGAAALGPAIEIDAANAALAIHLEGGFAFDAFRARIAALGTTYTGIDQSGEPLDRLSSSFRLDAGLSVARTADWDLAILAGLGASISIVRAIDRETEIVRAAPIASLSILFDLRLAAPLWLRAEIGGDAPLIRDEYLAVPGASADGIPDVVARAPAATFRALIGFVVRGE
jgi:hypothetical protein